MFQSSPPSDLLDEVGRLALEVEKLRRTLRRHGHAQEVFQARVSEQVERLAGEGAGKDEELQGRGVLSKAQLRSLLELDRAVLHLGLLARGGPGQDDDWALADAPASVREGLDLLGVRVQNLQHSFGLEPIPAIGQPFDDRLHRAHSLAQRDDLPHLQIVEELLPGYCLDGRVLRPALVIVNHREEASASKGPPES